MATSGPEVLVDAGSSVEQGAGGALVDVVVTVYDALDYVRACLASLQRNTDGFTLRVIVVNDASGPETTTWLRDAARAWPALVLIEHEQNQGYTRAVNAGLRASSASWVVVLNSDTVVTRGWLTGLVRCAEARPEVGLVGPLSNAASWQSVPQLFDPNGEFAVNQLDAGLDAEGMAELVRAVSARAYSKVSVLNGFCLLLRREVIDRVGFMDDVAFGVGYGEENDYCLRAADAGFELAVADDSYVFHAKSKSFGHARRIEYTRRGAEALHRKHGELRVRELSRGAAESRELYQLRGAVRAELGRRIHGDALLSRRLRLLFLLPVNGPSGGAGSVILEAAEMKRLGASAHVVVPEHALGELASLYADVPGVRELLIAPPLEQLLELSKDYDVVVATAFLTMEWVARIVAANPQILPAYYVQDYEPWFYPVGSADAAAAASSYTRVPGALLFAKTRFLVETVARLHAVEAKKVLPGIDHATYRPAARRSPGVLRVTAMVRPQTPRRAAARTMRVLRELARRAGSTCEIHVFGCETNDARFQQLERDFEFENHGVLRRSRVAELLRDSDIFVDLSDYQAFGRTSVEAMASGCVAIVPRIGGGEEFAIDAENALVVDPTHEAACVERIARLLGAPDELARLRASALEAAARFSVAGAAQSELEVLSAGAKAWRAAHPVASRRHLTLVPRQAAPIGRLALGATFAAWRATGVHRSWRVVEQSTLPMPGSADVAVIALGLSTNWQELRAWLKAWRRTQGRVIVQLEIPEAVARRELTRPTRSQSSAFGWLAQAVDALSVSSAAGQRFLGEQGIEAELVPVGLDPIAWRLGPCARRPAPQSSSAPLTIGLFGYAVTSELRQVVRQLKTIYAGRLAIEVLGGGQRFTRLGKTRRLPSSGAESVRADWAFANVRWDLALFPASRHDTELQVGLLELSALGVPAFAVDHEVAQAVQAVRQMLETRALRTRLADDARSALELRQDSPGDLATARLLERVLAAPLRSEVPVLPRGLRGSSTSSWSKRQVDNAAPGGPASFPEPRSKVRRKLDKLRRDPTGFLRDSRLGRSRLLKGLFD